MDENGTGKEGDRGSFEFTKSCDDEVNNNNHSIKVHVRAPNQHARFIERRGALTRDSLHRVDTQLRAEGITDVPFPMRLQLPA